LRHSSDEQNVNITEYGKSRPNGEVLSLTEENAVDMRSFGGGLLVAKDSRLSPAQTTAKVKYKLHIQELYLCLKRVSKVQ